MALALAVRVVHLGRDDLWSDEIHTLNALDGSFLDVVRERLAAGHLPLYFLLMKAWTALVGTSQFMLRLPSAILGAAALVPAYALMRRLAGHPTAIATALLLEIHPLLVELSREARMYPLLLVLFLVVAESAVSALKTGRIPARMLVAAGLGALVHPSWGFGVLALGIFVALHRDESSRRTRHRILAVLAVSGALLVLGLLGSAAQQPELTRRPWPREIGVFVLRLVAGAGILDRWLLFYLVLFPVWAACATLGFLRSSPRVRRFGLLLIAVPIVTCVAAGLLFGTPLGPVRYVQLSAVGITLFAAAGIRPGLLRVALVSVILVGLGLRFVPPRTSWSDLVRAVGVETPACFVVGGPPEKIQLEHYLGREVYIAEPPDDVSRWIRVVIEENGRVRAIPEPAPLRPDR